MTRYTFALCDNGSGCMAIQLNALKQACTLCGNHRDAVWARTTDLNGVQGTAKGGGFRQLPSLWLQGMTSRSRSAAIIGKAHLLEPVEHEEGTQRSKSTPLEDAFEAEAGQLNDGPDGRIADLPEDSDRVDKFVPARTGAGVHSREKA